MRHVRRPQHYGFNVLAVAALALTTMTAQVTGNGGAEDCRHGKTEQTTRPAEHAKAFDEATGRDLRNFPPDCVVDFLHMKLQMRFDDLNQKKFSATETLTISPIGTATTSLTLDAVGLKINAVKLGESDHSVEFSTDDKHLSLRFDPPLVLGQKQDLVIEYVCDHPADGMFFTPVLPDAPDYSAEVHTQGEADSNRYWFVCHDFPNDRMSTELIVDVPAEYSVSSNGKLVSNLNSGDRGVWHWLQEKPHVAYLVSLVIGKFDVIDIPHPRVQMRVWVPPGQGELVAQTYGRTGEMLDLFERRFGVPYPWERYDQILAKNFGAGGMENTSVTTLYGNAILDKTALLDGDIEGLISHELCHQWTGDYITCKSWAHIWLNEGWATFGNDLWEEQRFGIEGYLDAMRDEFDVAKEDKTAVNDTPMVSCVYDDPDDVFGRIANPYPKGAAILHMLRMMLGEDVFWRGVRLYFMQNGMGLVETNDLRYAMEEASGRSLEWFFEQWCYRPGTPELAVKMQYDAGTRELIIDVEQKQKIDERTPAFRFALPVVVRCAASAEASGVADRAFVIAVDSKAASFRTTLDGPPTMVAVDANLHVLKTMVEDKPLPWWIEQVRSGPTIVARRQAVEALAQHDSLETTAVLADLIKTESDRHTLRNAAVDALSKFASPEAREALLKIATEGPSEAKVRARLVEKLRNYDKAQAMEALARYAGNDASYATRAAAIDGLAALKCNERADLMVSLVDFESRNDQVRNAALKALAAVDDARGLDLAMKFAAYGHRDRARPAAIEVVGKLAEHDKDRAVEFLLKLLDDPESRSVSAAGAALAEVGDMKAESRLQAIAESAPDPDLRERAKGWLETLRKKK